VQAIPVEGSQNMHRRRFLSSCVAAGAVLFAFIVSPGELNTGLFLTTPQVKALPIELFGYLQFQGNQLVVAAASTVQIGLVLVVMLLLEGASHLGLTARARNSDD
jgi:ABC-type spermidine/putrescine transport system permease subunit II